MRSAESNSFLKDPLIWGNLLFRLALVAFVIVTGHWRGGDTSHYIGGAVEICQGAWGGEPGRVPGYLWFLSAFSGCWLPGVSGHIAAGFPVGLALFVQTLLVWSCGALLLRATHPDRRKIAFFWIFDPVLLIYSNLVMSDAFYAVVTLLTAVLFQRVLEKKRSSGLLAALGAGLAALMLVRPIGLPLAIWTLLFLAYAFFRAPADRKNWRKGALQWLKVFGVCAALVAPRLYWNVTRHQQWTLAQQGAGWIQTVVAAVVYDKEGLSFRQAEEKWFAHYPAGQPQPYKILVEHFPSWLKLSVKGMARVFFGHVNVEASYVATGKSPAGPSWFKEGVQGDGLSRIGVLFWGLGLLLTAGFCFLVYWFLIQGLFKSGLNPFAAWALSSAFWLAAIPQIFGDARFRAPVWALVLLAWSSLKGKG